jgi:glycosyltransferase involved in cell wall biosynthesis
MLLNQYYYPDLAPTAQLAADLGEELVRRGHQVTAVACSRSYSGEARLPHRDAHAGVRILRVPSTAFGRGTRLGRAVDYGSFLVGALQPLLTDERPDVVVALSTPPLVAALGLMAQRLRRTRFVYWVMDVYPELAVRLGALSPGGWPARALARLGQIILERADAVVALDERMRDRLVAGGAARGKIEVIDNWCDGAAIRPRDEANPLRRSLGLDETFTVSYSGNMGLAHDFDTIARAVALSADEPVHWLFIGDGPRRAAFEASVAGFSGDRVTFLPYQSREALPVSLTAADASLVTLERDLDGLLVPSKVYSALAAGLPVLYVGPEKGRVADLVRNEGVGIAVANGDAQALASAVRRLRRDPDERAAMGRRARALFEARFDRPLALERHHRLLCRLVADRC